MTKKEPIVEGGGWRETTQVVSRQPKAGWAWGSFWASTVIAAAVGMLLGPQFFDKALGLFLTGTVLFLAVLLLVAVLLSTFEKPVVSSEKALVPRWDDDDSEPPHSAGTLY